jgi:hypothetical protein
MVKMIRTGESMTAEQLEQFCKSHPDNKTEEAAVAREVPSTDEAAEKPKKKKE